MSFSPQELFNIVQIANSIGLADFKAGLRKQNPKRVISKQDARQRADNILACLAATVTKAATEGEEYAVIMSLEDDMYELSYYGKTHLLNDPSIGKPKLLGAAALVFDDLKNAKLDPVLQYDDMIDTWQILLYLNVSVEPASVPPTIESNHHKALQALKDIINAANNGDPYDSVDLQDNFSDILNEAYELGVRLPGE